MGGSREPIEPSQHWQVLRSADPVLASTGRVLASADPVLASTGTSTRFSAEH